MNSHRSDKIPDWEKIDPSEWNAYQKRAAETNGWDTPGNRESAKGFIASSLGVVALHQEKYFAATGLLLYGRLKDLKDGKRSDETGTKSPKGEGVDAGIDKALMAMILPVLYEKGIVNEYELAALIAQHGGSAILTGIAKINDKEMHPSKPGKISTGLEWGAIGIGVVGKGFKKLGFSMTADIFETVEKITMTAGLGLGAVATVGYARDAFGLNDSVEQQPIESMTIDLVPEIAQ